MNPAAWVSLVTSLTVVPPFLWLVWQDWRDRHDADIAAAADPDPES